MQKNESYTDQLKDSRWKKKRSLIIKRDKFKCTECGCLDTLNVHHKYYVKGKKAWEYPNNALITLCEKCHTKWHEEHVIEVRDKIWCKNREYRVSKKVKKSRKRVKKVERLIDTVEKRRYTSYTGHNLSERQIKILRARDHRKEEMIKEYFPDSWKDVFEKTRSLTISELEKYLSIN